MPRKVLYKKMKNFAFRLLCLIAAVLFAAGCSNYSKLLKSKDPDKMYKAAIEFFDQKKYQRTIHLLEECSPYFSSTTKADTILYYTAMSYYKMGDFDISGQLFDEFRRTFGNSAYLEDAEYCYAMGFYYSSPSPERDQTTTIQAMTAIDDYLGRYPNSVKEADLKDKMKELEYKLHDKSYLNAKTYYKIEKYKSAVVALKNAIDKYPESKHREEMMFLILKSQYLLSKDSFSHLQRDRYMKVLDYYYNFVSEFPDSKYAKEANKMHDETKEHLDQYNQDHPEDNNTNTDNTNGTEKE